MSVVRLRKRKATQPKDRGRDMSRVSKRHGGLAQVKGNTDRGCWGFFNSTAVDRHGTCSNKKLNSRGQVYGFVRFLNVKNKDKLAQALNNVWIGEHRVWASEARYDRLVQLDVENRDSINGIRSGWKDEEVRPVVNTHGECRVIFRRSRLFD
ncbi:hypothetical protein MTR_0007s0010 [Medicago truncatula]|uniref:RRM domain-containing protein n=1 Tax=Medicago truncatula TaxID=3880 RepID=A0A072TVJ8_MEDTR|nr:hypothetical protein MTR_0007s0010 [Medicago truncatula]